MELTKDNMKKIMFLIVFTILVLAAVLNLPAVWNVAGIFLRMLMPFILGGAIAFILNMPMRWVEKLIFHRKWFKCHPKAGKAARPVSLLLALAIVVSIIVVVISVVVPSLGTTVAKLIQDITAFWPKVQAWGIKISDDNPEVVNWLNSITINWEKIMQNVIGFLRSGAGSLLGSTFSAAKVIVSGAANFVIAFVFAVYILLQKEKLMVQIRKVLYAFLKESVVEQILSVSSLTSRTFSSFFAGQCVEAVILGSMFVVSMAILRFPYAILIGILIAFTALIPMFGAFIGCFLGAFLILMENPVQALGFIVLFLVLQQIEGNLIYPHVVGGSVGLPSIWVLVAVTLGGSLMGIVGMLIFIPLVSVIYTLFRGYIYKRLKKRKLLAKAERSSLR